MEKINADVIVVAAGLSGLAASISAAENGASVVQFEKNSSTGGAANMGMGPLGVGSRFQKHHMVSLTAGEAFRKHMNFTHWKVDSKLVKKYYDKSGDTINWLEDMGVQFLTVSRAYPAPEILKAYATSEESWHVVRPDDGSNIPGPRCASAMIKKMTERANDLGVDIHLNTPVKKLLFEDGAVVGVIAENSDGEQIEARAKAVIIATGGAGNNTDMIKEHTGYEWGKNLFSFRIPGAEGEGMKMAWEVGAAKTPLTLELMYQCPDNMNHFIADGAFRQPALWVNALGQRFINEDGIANTTFAGNAIANQPGQCAFALLTDGLVKHYKKNGPDIQSHVHPHNMYEIFHDAINSYIESGYEYVYAADTIEELAEKMGVNLENLLETVETYNEMCESGYDHEFEKDRSYLVPFKKGKFYAVKYFPGAYGTLGGIKVNHNLEAIDENYNKIPGLYAVGVDSCAIFGESYPFILPGNSMGYCLNSGRMAGENATDYAFAE